MAHGTWHAIALIVLQNYTMLYGKPLVVIIALLTYRQVELTRRPVELPCRQVEMTRRRNMLLYFNVKFDASPS